MLNYWDEILNKLFGHTGILPILSTQNNFSLFPSVTELLKYTNSALNP